MHFFLLPGIATLIFNKPSIIITIYTMHPCLLKNSPSFYSTPTPKGWHEV